MRFGGLIDNLGGDLLSGLVRHVGLWGDPVTLSFAPDAVLRLEDPEATA